MKSFNPLAALVALAFLVGAVFAPLTHADFTQDPAGSAAQVQFDGSAGGEGGEWEGDWDDDDDDDDEEDEWEGGDW